MAPVLPIGIGATARPATSCNGRAAADTDCRRRCAHSTLEELRPGHEDFTAKALNSTRDRGDRYNVTAIVAAGAFVEDYESWFRFRRCRYRSHCGCCGPREEERPQIRTAIHVFEGVQTDARKARPQLRRMPHHED